MSERMDELDAVWEADGLSLSEAQEYIILLRQKLAAAEKVYEAARAVAAWDIDSSTSYGDDEFRALHHAIAEWEAQQSNHE